MISIDFKVVGLTFVDKYPMNIEVIHRMVVARRLAARGVTGGASPYQPVRVDLVRNPDNEHDPNAVEVHVPPIGMIGHAPRGVAMDLAPCLDSEPNRWTGYVDHVLVHRNDPTLQKPGIQIHAYEVALRPDGSQVLTGNGRASYASREEMNEAARLMKRDQEARLAVAEMKGGTGS